MTTVTLTIDAPRAEVWDALVDVRTYPTWLIGARRIRSIDDGWPAPGTAFHHVVGVGPIKIADATRSVELEEGRHLELEVRARPALVATVVFDLSDDEGGTVVTMEEHPTGIHRLLAPLAAPLAQARNRASLARLEERVRARMSGAGAAPPPADDEAYAGEIGGSAGSMAADPQQSTTTEDGKVVEPENSTVNDWHGQKVADDMEMVDEVLEATDGDEQAAEEAFEERSAQNDPERDIDKPKPS